MARIVTPTKFEQVMYARNIRNENLETVRDSIRDNLRYRQQLGQPTETQPTEEFWERQIVRHGRPRLQRLFDENVFLESEIERREAEERRRQRREQKARLEAANALIQLREMNPRYHFVSLTNVLRDKPRPGTPRPDKKRKL